MHTAICIFAEQTGHNSVDEQAENVAMFGTLVTRKIKFCHLS